jgi:hypothetical protein
MTIYTTAFTLFFAMGRVSGEAQQIAHRIVMVDLSPSMKSHRTQQLETVKKTLEAWQPNQAIEIIGVNENPLGHAPLGQIAPFPYDSTKSNPTRYQIDSAILRKKHLETILPAVEQAIIAEDAKNKRHPERAETCLLDGMEVAARAFRRIPSQSRELIVLSDGYEDCQDSIHLPRERLSSARIEAIIHEFERQSRLPHFPVPTAARFIGMRRNRLPRAYEDQVESLWIKLLTRCGLQIRSENFSPTLLPQGGN